MRSLLTIFCLFTFGSIAFGQGETVNVYLTGNRVINTQVIALDQTSISFQAQNSKTTATLPYNQIESIEWPEPDAWKNAVTLLQEEKFDEAIQLFSQITRAQQRFTKHPAPGNFSTRARRMLIEAHRRKMDGASIKTEFAALKPELRLLPPLERKLLPIYEGWIYASEKNWNEVLNLVAKYPRDADLALLEGYAHLAKSDSRAAGLAFTKAYTLDGGGNTAVAALTLRESIQLQPTSVKIHTWATIFGKGKLWEGAPQSAIELLAKPIASGHAVQGEAESTDEAEKFNTPEEKAKRIEPVK